MNIITVSELTKQIKTTLEEGFPQVSVIGEISGFKAHNSGHWYFNLKDSDAVICCTMWRSFNGYVFFTPRDGMKVIVSGKLSVYPPRGNYQVDVRFLKPAGAGELQAAFEELKQKLAAEGLFDEAYKKPVSGYSEKIGVVTAIDGAAFKDMISVAQRRFPLTEIVIAPARVQGNGAAESIVEGIRALNKRKDIGVIIVARGGGSIEDLWAFNEEIVARAIFASKTPVISGVGHEIDFTIADFVADLRAPTPSAAMEIATPNMDDIIGFINGFDFTSTKTIEKLCRTSGERVKNILNSYGFRQPVDVVRRYNQQVDNLAYRLDQVMDRKLLKINNNLSLLTKTIESHDTRKILKKGFAIVRQDQKIVKRTGEFNWEKEAGLEFFDGIVRLKPEELKENPSKTS
jgi:exodeoxyribonuclease VII large subunit